MTNYSFARIAVNAPLARGEYDYHIPPELTGRIEVGHLVTVPFGRQTLQGVILDLPVSSVTVETRPILNLLDPLPVVSANQIALARWMAIHFLSPLAPRMHREDSD